MATVKSLLHDNVFKVQTFFGGYRRFTIWRRKGKLAMCGKFEVLPPGRICKIFYRDGRTERVVQTT